MTVSDFLLNRLAQWGVDRIYGYPGDGINGIMGALDRASDRMQFIQARHEELAAFMACAHAKFTGRVGVCLATSGPGAIHLLNGLYDAKLDHQPVVAIVGQQARSALGGSYQQEVDLISLFKDVAHEYVQMAATAEQIRHLVDRAIRIAQVERTVTCLIIPHDVQDHDAIEEPPRKHGTIHSGIGLPVPIVVPQDHDLQHAAEVLNGGERVAILAGAGALHAGDELIAVADRLGAGVAKALLGKAALPDDLPFVTGAIGLLGTRPSWNLMNECDTLLMVGSSFPYSEFLPVAGQARDIRIRRGMRASLSGTLATMGPAVPYAIAAKFCHPHRFVLAMVGDGSMQMNGLNGLIAIAKYWEEWSNPRLVVLVLNNRDLNQVTWEQRAMAGDPKFPASQDVPDFPYAKFAESLGLIGVRVDRPDDIAGAWDYVLGADRPALLEAVTDPNVPPLPPHITWEQARAFASSVLKGDAEALGFVTQTVKDAVESYLPKRS